MKARRLGPILLVDDDPDALFLFVRAARDMSLQHDLHMAPDGLQAIGYLRRALQVGTRLPAVTILDLVMPGRTGFEVLEWMRRSPPLRRLPIIMMSDSGEPKDVERAYVKGADAWLQKPSTLDDLRAIIRHLQLRWLRVPA